MSVAGNAMNAYGTYSKVNDLFESFDEFKKTYNNPSLTGTQKVAHCTAEATFMSARCGELCSQDPITMPVLNTVATVSDIGRTLIKANNEQQELSQTVLKTAKAVLSGAGETIINISKITNSIPATIFGFTLSVGGVALSFYERYYRSSSAIK